MLRMCQTAMWFATRNGVRNAASTALHSQQAHNPRLFSHPLLLQLIQAHAPLWGEFQACSSDLARARCLLKYNITCNAVLTDLRQAVNNERLPSDERRQFGDLLMQAHEDITPWNAYLGLKECDQQRVAAIPPSDKSLVPKAGY